MGVTAEGGSSPPLGAAFNFRCDAPATMKATKSKTSQRRRRRTFADGSQLTESFSGYVIYEGIPKRKRTRRKATPAKSSHVK
jgi:hypothetical protein